jgi:hypothetical protein
MSKDNQPYVKKGNVNPLADYVGHPNPDALNLTTALFQPEKTAQKEAEKIERVNQFYKIDYKVMGKEKVVENGREIERDKRPEPTYNDHNGSSDKKIPGKDRPYNNGQELKELSQKFEDIKQEMSKKYGDKFYSPAMLEKHEDKIADLNAKITSSVVYDKISAQSTKVVPGYQATLNIMTKGIDAYKELDKDLSKPGIKTYAYATKINIDNKTPDNNDIKRGLAIALSDQKRVTGLDHSNPTEFKKLQDIDPGSIKQNILIEFQNRKTNEVTSRTVSGEDFTKLVKNLKQDSPTIADYKKPGLERPGQLAVLANISDNVIGNFKISSKGNEIQVEAPQPGMLDKAKDKAKDLLSNVVGKGGDLKEQQFRPSETAAPLSPKTEAAKVSEQQSTWTAKAPNSESPPTSPLLGRRNDTPPTPTSEDKSPNTSPVTARRNTPPTPELQGATPSSPSMPKASSDPVHGRPAAREAFMIGNREQVVLPEKTSQAIAAGLVTAGRGKAELDPKVIRQVHNALESPQVNAGRVASPAILANRQVNTEKSASPALLRANAESFPVNPKILQQAHNVAESLHGTTVVRGGQTGLRNIHPISGPGTPPVSQQKGGRS